MCQKLRKKHVVFSGFGLVLSLGCMASHALANPTNVQSQGDWVSAAYPDQGIVVAQTRSKKQWRGYDQMLDVYFLIDNCRPTPSMEYTLSGLHPELLSSLYKLAETGRSAGGIGPTVQINYSGSKVKIKSPSFSVKQVDVFRVEGQGNLINLNVPLNSKASGLTNTVDSLKKGNGISAKIELPWKDANKVASISVENQFSLKGSSASINRAHTMCENLAAGRRADHNLSSTVRNDSKRSQQPPQASTAPYESCGNDLSRCKRLCESGEGDVCHQLGIITKKAYFGVKENFGKALTLFDSACSLDSGKGCRSYGYMLFYGQGTKVNEIEATNFYKKGCRLGDAASCSNFANAYLDSVEIKNKVSDKERYRLAYVNYTKACELKDRIACDSLSRLYENGWHVKKSVEKAHKMLVYSCLDLNYAEACHNAGFNVDPNGANILAKGRNSWVSEVETDPSVLYAKGCDLGFSRSCDHLDVLLNASAAGGSKPVVPSSRQQPWETQRPQRIDRFCKATLRDLFQYGCDQVYVDQSKIQLCELAASNVEKMCPPGTLRQMVMPNSR